MPFVFELNYLDGVGREELLLCTGRSYRTSDGCTQAVEEQAAWCEVCRRIVPAE
ncbi:hypothetical protein [Limnoglobus roseus]|uniref:Uncharacterized protein n=1 Tax=Limnoglobus roseus TaxID=2598579 RepID=A0A5C1A832_9BACT|nr:hypothetical protein [Limnoglobus roseus]QEL15479.1 hypothetical protein PX52LOC_02402 [Limnoglobus roseus]